MAVDWTGYRLTPDLSGLAQGIAQYGANKQQSAQFQQEMDYKNRALAAEQERIGRIGAGKNTFYADLFKKGDRYYRMGIAPDGTPIEIPMPEGFEPITTGISSLLTNAPAIAEAKALEERAKKQAGAEVELAYKPEIEKQSTLAKGGAEAATVGATKEAEETGKQRAAVFSGLRSGYDAANKLEPTLAEIEKAMNLASQGKYAQASTAVGKLIPGIDVSNEEAFNSSILQYSTEKLLTIPGIATDADFQNQLKSFVSQGNQKEANQLIIDRVKRQNEYNKYAYKSYNQEKNRLGDKFDPLSWEQPSYYQFLEEKGLSKPATPQSEMTQEQIDYEAKKRALGF